MALDHRFHILLPVWGSQYTQTFLDYLAPSLLAEGNLPAWPFCERTVLQIATRQEDAWQMEANPVFQRLRHFLPVQFQIFEGAQFAQLGVGERFEAKYEMLNQIMAILLQGAMAASAHVIPLMSDTLLASHFFSYLHQALEADIRLLLLAGPRLAFQTKPLLEVGRQAGGALALTPRQLNGLVFGQLHPHEQACFIDAPVFSQWPSHVYYWENSTQIRSHWFHLHPFFLYRPQVAQGQSGVSIEGELLNQYAEQREQIRVVQASETAACSVSDSDQDMPAWGLSSTLAERHQSLIRFGEKNCFPLQRWFFGHPIVFELGDEA